MVFDSSLISVIIPVYKVEKYLRRCLDSVLNQTYQNIEIILIDDGSPDKCPEICDEYEKRDKRIRVIHKKNSGLADVRNIGVECASGEYISFVDSDDFIANNYLEVLYEGLKTHGADISIVSYRNFEQKQKKDNQLVFLPFVECSIEQAMTYYSSIKPRVSIPFISACCKLYKKNLFQNVKYPLGKLYEDSYTTYKLLSKSSKTVFSQKQLYWYNINTESIMGRRFSSRYIEAVEAFYEAMIFFKENSTVKKSLYKAMLARGLYCWWGMKYLLKEELAAKEVLQLCQKCLCDIKLGRFEKVLYRIVLKNPWFYHLYKMLSLLHIGNR